MLGARVARLLIPAMLVLRYPAQGSAQEGALPTIQDLVAVRSLGDPQLSPDSRYVALVVRSAHGQKSAYETRIYIAPVGPGDVRPLTRSGLAARSPRWSPTGTHLAFLAPAGEGEGARVQVWLLPTEGGEAQPLTGAPDGVRAFAWTPDGSAVVYLARESEAETVGAWTKQRRERKDDARVVHGDRRPMALWRIPVRSGGRAERLFLGDAGLREFALSPDGRYAAVTTNYSGLADDDTDLWVADLMAGTARRLTSRQGSESSPAFSPDGRSIAFLAPQKPALSYSQPEIFLVPVQGGEPRSLTAGFDRAVVAFDWPARSKRILFAAAAGTDQHLYRLDPSSGDARLLLGGERVVRAFAASSSGNEVYAILSTPGALEDLYLVEDEERLRRLSELNRELERNVAWARQEVVRWASPDGTPVEGVVTYPHDFAADRRYPLVLEIHGGPYGRVTNTLPGRSFAQLWAARGYLVLQPNFRGSQGYGEAFGIANRGDLGGGDYRDVMAGVDALIERGLVDPERMGVTGGSYGGYLTNWVIGQTDRFAAAISLYGIFSLVTDYSNSNIPSWEVGYLGGHYWDDLGPYLKHSPMTYIKNVRTPTLILHGEADDNTVVANSMELYQALRALGREVEFVLYPREGHGIAGEPKHVVDKWSRMRRWFDARVLARGRPELLAFEVGDSVPALPGGAEGWTLRVTRAERASGYAGASGKYLEIELLLSRAGAAAALELELTGPAADLRLERAGDAPVAAAGLPVTRLGPPVLVEGAGQRVRLAGAGDDARAAALALAFPLPAPGLWRLRVKGFAPVLLHLGAEAPQRTAAR